MLTKRRPHIVFVTDHGQTRQSLSSSLANQNFRVTVVTRTREVFRQCETNKVDVLLLDATNSDGSGLDLCRKLRDQRVSLPIILFTSGGDPVDRIIGLELGADDCVDKPLNEKEVAARVRARMRTLERSQESAANIYSFDGLVLDLKGRKIHTSGGTPLSLTSAEFDLLSVFVSRAGKKLTRLQLLDLTDRQITDESARSIDVLVSRIRRKLQLAANRDFISTIRNVGYQFTADVTLLDAAAEQSGID